jgi:anaerobic carbon-monoxide dehydrogenase iron sulfur subunit
VPHEEAEAGRPVVAYALGAERQADLRGVEVAKKGLLVNPDKCTGCHRCDLWCSLTKDGVCNPSRARVHVLRREPDLDTPVACTHCGVCISACPFDAISRNVKTGAVVIEEAACKKCGICVMACPIGMITYPPDSKVPVKCDLCGGDPECVKHCRDGALTYQDYAVLAARKREEYGRSLAHEAKAGAATNLLLDLLS